MKVSTQRTVIIETDQGEIRRFTDPAHAAEFWARVKSEEWVEANRKNTRFFEPGRYGRPPHLSNLLYDAGRVRYRKLKRRALRIFRRVMEINS